MEIYKIGKISYIGKNYLILEANFSGWKVNIAQPFRFITGENRRIYIYQHNNEYSNTLYGFDTLKEKILFEDLLTLQGIGPKTALNILENDWEKIALHISAGDEEALSYLNHITPKIARQIVFNFENKYKFLMKKDNVEYVEESKKIKQTSEVSNTLKTLGFKENQIDFAMSKIEISPNIENMIEEAIKVISNEREFRTEAH